MFSHNVRSSRRAQADRDSVDRIWLLSSLVECRSSSRSQSSTFSINLLKKKIGDQLGLSVARWRTLYLEAT